MGKSTNSMAMFNSYVANYQRVKCCENAGKIVKKGWEHANFIGKM
jgi:hypothetical protein